MEHVVIVQRIPASRIMRLVVSIFSSIHIFLCFLGLRPQKKGRKISAAEVVDHHATNEKDLEELPAECKIFDMKKAGCTLAWEFFNDEEPLRSELVNLN